MIEVDPKLDTVVLFAWLRLKWNDPNLSYNLTEWLEDHGENVSTAEVAAVLGRFPAIAEANVYGVEGFFSLALLDWYYVHWVLIFAKSLMLSM